MIRDRQDNQGIRLTSLVIVIFLGLLLSVFFAAGKFSPQRPAYGGLQVSLADGINPNTASVASLVRLPGIGRVKAEAIVVYRQNFSASGKNARAFKDASDLDKVSGIGPKTVEDTKRFLKFE
jgi:competence ComEA-like helix-hairpin-helix protein